MQSKVLRLAHSKTSIGSVILQTLTQAGVLASDITTVQWYSTRVMQYPKLYQQLGPFFSNTGDSMDRVAEHRLRLCACTSSTMLHSIRCHFLGDNSPLQPDHHIRWPRYLCGYSSGLCKPRRVYHKWIYPSHWRWWIEWFDNLELSSKTAHTRLWREVSTFPQHSFYSGLYYEGVWGRTISTTKSSMNTLKRLARPCSNSLSAHLTVDLSKAFHTSDLLWSSNSMITIMKIMDRSWCTGFLVLSWSTRKWTHPPFLFHD